jgi:hypothetical protein
VSLSEGKDRRKGTSVKGGRMRGKRGRDQAVLSYSLISASQNE